MATPDPVYIFRMVHWQNIEYILTHGLCCKNHQLTDPNYINIGDRTLIAAREDSIVPIPGYGTLGDYIPFYFWGHSPMLYIIMKGYQGVTKYPQKDIVFIVVNSADIIAQGADYVFTDRHAKSTLAQFSTNPDDLHLLKWDVIRSKDWKNTENDFQRMDFKQAEFLVKDHIPVNFINRIFVKTEAKKVEIEIIVRNLGLDIPVIVAREGKLYY
ncbi:type II toxin-antitoxin system toxin DNA ADP-ribosyl transferase DarT [Sphingobacterium luzhongxinii]|uniref:type II toxin-antitoxin system toxin DNA ADP-ribosyl transferase DarT n=1 Tax=Sphingobacterium luzhongxinii TaxID=2654181 RepID=UPI0013DC087A|nr:DUF4433 domain-containing protein [Sphingobacterium sp. xlx-73]